MILLIFLLLAAIFTLAMLGIPLAFAFACGSFLLAFIMGTDPNYFITQTYASLEGYALIALPLFIYMGYIIEGSGMGKALVDFIQSIFGHVKGGLGAVCCWTCAVLGAVAGAGAAAIAAVGSVIIPRAVAHGYPRGYITALVAVSSVLTLLIPPSIPMILFAVAARISIAAAFLTTVFPGIMIATLYSLYNFWVTRTFTSITVPPRVSFGKGVREVAATGVRSLPILILPLIIIGGIYGGLVGPTEAAAVGAVYAILMCTLLRRVTPKGLVIFTARATVITGVCMAMLFSTQFLSFLLLYERFPHQVAEFLLSGGINRYVLLAVMNVFLLIIGMFMDDFSGSIVSATLLLPVVTEFGIHPLHFAAIVGVNLGLGNITPPVAPLLYLAGAVAGNPPLKDYLVPAMRFLLVGHLPVLILVTYLPGVALWLPQVVLGVKF